MHIFTCTELRFPCYFTVQLKEHSLAWYSRSSEHIIAHIRLRLGFVFCSPVCCTLLKYWILASYFCPLNTMNVLIAVLCSQYMPALLWLVLYANSLCYSPDISISISVMNFILITPHVISSMPFLCHGKLLFVLWLLSFSLFNPCKILLFLGHFSSRIFDDKSCRKFLRSPNRL